MRVEGAFRLLPYSIRIAIAAQITGLIEKLAFYFLTKGIPFRAF